MKIKEIEEIKKHIPSNGRDYQYLRISRMMNDGDPGGRFHQWQRPITNGVAALDDWMSVASQVLGFIAHLFFSDRCGKVLDGFGWVAPCKY